jgi:hypothetical protein
LSVDAVQLRPILVVLNTTAFNPVGMDGALVSLELVDVVVALTTAE